MSSLSLKISGRSSLNWQRIHCKGQQRVSWKLESIMLWESTITGQWCHTLLTNDQPDLMLNLIGHQSHPWPDCNDTYSICTPSWSLTHLVKLKHDSVNLNAIQWAWNGLKYLISNIVVYRHTHSNIQLPLDNDWSSSGTHQTNSTKRSMTNVRTWCQVISDIINISIWYYLVYYIVLHGCCVTFNSYPMPAFWSFSVKFVIAAAQGYRRSNIQNKHDCVCYHQQMLT